MDGLDLSLFFMERVQFEWGLFRIVACMEENRYIAKGLMTHVVPWEPTATTHSGNHQVVLLDKGYWRYNRLARDLTLDQVIAVSPFHDCLSLFPGLLGSAITAL